MSRLKAIINKIIKYAFLPTHSPSVSDLFRSADQSLFQSVIHNPHHVLHQLLPPVKSSGYTLQSQSHSTPNNIHLHRRKKCFINRMIYTDIHWHLTILCVYCLYMYNQTYHSDLTCIYHLQFVLCTLILLWELMHISDFKRKKLLTYLLTYVIYLNI